MAHVPTVIKQLEALEVVKHASATWNVAISVTYEDRTIKRRGQLFSLNDLEHMTNQELIYEIMAGIEGDIVP